MSERVATAGPGGNAPVCLLASRGFASDNYAGAHPEVLAALAAANEGHVVAYGEDIYTEHLQEVIRKPMYSSPMKSSLPASPGSCRCWDCCSVEAALPSSGT